MLKQKCEISNNFVPDVKQTIWRRLVGMRKHHSHLLSTIVFVIHLNYVEFIVVYLQLEAQVVGLDGMDEV